MRARWRHPPGDGAVVVLAALTCLAVWWHTWTGAAALAVLAVAALVRRAPAAALVGVVLVVVGTWRAGSAWHDVEPRRLGPYVGWVEVVGDPVPYGKGLRVTVEIDG